MSDNPHLTFDRLVHRVTPLAFEKQLWLSHVLDEVGEDWQFDMAAGTITFGGKLRLDVQILGTESEQNNTWLWAWANQSGAIPDELLQSARQLQVYGKKQKIPALVTTQEIPLSERYNGHQFAMIASIIAASAAYYRGPYEGGAVFLLLQADGYPSDNRHPVQRILFTFPVLLQTLAVDNHRSMFSYYLRSHQLTVSQKGDNIVGTASDGQVITATFDDKNRLVDLSHNNS